MASGVHHIARDKCNFPGNLQTKSDRTNSINMKQVSPSNFSPWKNFESYFPSPSTGKSTTPPAMDICHIYTLGVSSNISHGRIKEAMDTNLLEVAGSSKTACTLATCNHLDSIRTTLLRLLAYCCLNATRERRQGFTQTTTKGDDYNHHKAKLQLSPRETHWQTLLHSFAWPLFFSVHYIVISAYFHVM